jgi:para-aminobenzoate synthetase component 1
MGIQPQQPIFCKPHVCQIETDISLPSLSEAVSGMSFPAILGGNESVDGWSIFAAEPVEVFEFSLHQDQPFDKLQAFLSRYQMADDVRGPSGMFCGGWIGFFGYELGRFIESLPATAVDDVGFPVIRLAFYDKAILFDHKSSEFSLMALEYKGQRQTVDQMHATLKSWIKQAQTIAAPASASVDMNSVSMDSLSSNMSRSQYTAALAKIKRYIYDGETYQINFSQRFLTDFKGLPVDLFHGQNRFNPSPYAAYLAWDDRAVVSASPELFLKVADDVIVTKPIKGTRPRNPSLPDQSPENTNCFHDLVTSEKEQAELAMIVDLERNDLARICFPGTRSVTCGRQIETFPTVYHAAATIQGQLTSPPQPRRMIEILKSSFPGGSITGAPKIRSMEIIDELEPTTRGIYTGSIGWISLNFDLCWNIAIRTILISGQKAYVQSGGGIVADSDPEAEWNETWTKARALLAGIDAVNRMQRH